jgi:signal transduction histidine kinase
VTKLAPATRDLVSVMVVGLTAFVVAFAFDLNDEIVEWAKNHPALEWLGIDELPVAFALIGLGLGWYAYRRRREHKAETEAHVRTLAQLRQAMDEVVTANQAKAQFLAAMSHELRTPLNAILGFSEIIRGEGMGPTVSERYRDYANDIHGAGSHLLSIVNDILDMARSDAGSLAFETVPIEAAELIDLVRRIVAPRARSGSVELRVDIAAQLVVHGDPDKLRQALLNVAHNAVKFTPEGGVVTLSCYAVGGAACLQVIDTGIGIAPQDITVALTPFRQIDGALQRKYEGAGLGLPLAKRYVEGQGGTLQLASTVGKGTVVTITLPLAPTMPEASPDKAGNGTVQAA